MTLVIQPPDQGKLLGTAFVDRFDKRTAVRTDAHSSDARGDEDSDRGAQPMPRRWAAGFIRFLEWPVVPIATLLLPTAGPGKSR
jgi:hypothetical protein